MKTYIHLPLDRRLSLAQTAIQNTLDDPELISYLAPYSYDEDRLQEGLELYETALDLHHRAASERGEKLGATADMHESWSTARARLRDHVALARIALRGNKGASAPLRLHEPRANTQAAWIVQSRQFYQRALEDTAVKDALARYNISEDDLRDGLESVTEFERSMRVRDKESGDAQDATHARNEAMAALDQWMRDFRDVVRVSLRDRPQLMERLGFLVRGS